MISPDQTLELAIDRFWETVPPLWGTIRAHIRAVATGNFDITVEQFHVLRYARRGAGSMSELAQAKNISRPAISQAVDVLVRKGLLTRVQSTHDRRFVEVSLTQAGNDLLQAVFSQTRAWMEERMALLTPEELDSIARAMKALQKMLDGDSQ